MPYSNSCGPENERISIQTIKLIGTQLDIIEVKDLNRKASEDKDNQESLTKSNLNKADLSRDVASSSTLFSKDQRSGQKQKETRGSEPSGSLRFGHQMMLKKSTGVTPAICLDGDRRKEYTFSEFGYT